MVLIRDNGVSWASRVCLLLVHTPHGCLTGVEAEVAHVCWYERVKRDTMSAALMWPVFMRHCNDDHNGNMWPIEKLAPCEREAVHTVHALDALLS